MASSVGRGIKTSGANDKFLVIAGTGHIDYRFGVPERLDKMNLVPKSDTCIITVRNGADVDYHENEEFGKVSKFETNYPGDYVLLYEDEEENDDDVVKNEISGDALLAEKVMTRLGYSKKQILIAGKDAYNYQGVGCPHGHAAIRKGER